MAYRILSIDGNYLARSRFEANATFSVANYLSKIDNLRKGFNPILTIIAWDAKVSQLRKKIYHEYKANRKQSDTFFHEIRRTIQKETPPEILQFTCADAEGDDILFTISRTMVGPHLIYTADKDMFQCISKDVDILKAGAPGKPDQVISLDNFEAFTGVPLGHYGDFLSLAGDSVDCVPGLPGIGEKRAKEILKQCPNFMDLILSSKDSEARQICYQNAQLAKWCELAIMRREDLKMSRELTRLYMVKINELQKT